MNELTDGISPWDIFFYYGKGDLDTETVSDLYELLLQPKRSLFYFRRFGGVTGFENYPLALEYTALMKYEIVNAVAYRNGYISNGQRESIDRRVATSQEFIDIENNKDGESDVKMNYFMFADVQNPRGGNFKLRR